MPSIGRRDHCRPTFVAEPPHFMKVIVADTKEIEMLRIPTKFTKMHGNSLSNTLCLRVPNGGMWKVDVVKKDGEVWLQNGWKDFAQYYSLKYRSLLVFRYNGNSNFWVLIFDKTASEIDYPIRNIQCEEPDSEEIYYRNDLPIQILDGCSTHASPQKKKKNNSTGETQNGANLLPSDSHFATTDTKSNMLKLEKSGRDLDQSSHDLGVSTQEKRCNVASHRQLQPKVPANTITISPADKASAFMRAEAFQPKNLSFRIVMQPSYMIGYKLPVPTNFAERFRTQKSGDLTLSVSDERRWSVRYVWNMYRKYTRVTFLCGWSAFVKDNNLKVGDACVFELINSRKSLLKVVIFRDTGDANCDVPLDNRSIGDRVQKRRMEPKVEPSEFSTDSLDDFSPRQRQEGKVRNKQLMLEDVSISQRPSSSGTAKALEPAGRSNPSFKCVMSASYVRARTMNVPGDIMKELTQKSAVTVMLKVADKLWPVNLLPYKNSKCGKLSAGFSAFLRENDIGLGNECVFELINKDGRILNVTILSCGGK